MVNPDYASLCLGRLRLKSKDSIDACSKHLHGLNVHEMLRVAAVNAVRGPPNFDDLPYIGSPSHAFGLTSNVDYSPLKVDISGLFSPFDHPSRTRSLRVLIVDRTHRLYHFQHILLESLFKADFLTNAYESSIYVVSTAMPSTMGHRCLYDPKTGRWSYPGRGQAPKVDASGIIHRWKDYDWATDIQLEKLCVHALGSWERLPGGGVREKQMTEIDSIPLPSFPKLMT